MSCRRRSGWVPRCRRLSAVSDVVVSTPPPMRFHRMSMSWLSSSRLPSNSNWTRKLVRSSPGSARRAAVNFSRPSIIAGTSAMALLYSSPSGSGHHGMEEVRIQLPVVVRQTHQPHGQDRRNGAGVVEHQVHLSVGDPLVEKPVHRLLHERPHLRRRRPMRRTGSAPAATPGGTDRRPRRCQAAVGPRARDTHFALVVHAVGCVRVRTCARRSRRRGRSAPPRRSR